MAQFTAQIHNVITNGPYAYVLYKDGIGLKSLDNVLTISAALDGVKADIAANLGGETVSTVTMRVVTG